MTQEKYTVLAIDDEEMLLKTLRRMLFRQYRMLAVSSLADALTLLEGEHPIDLILIDINMPDINGLDAIKVIREMERHHETPIIVLSGVMSEAVQRDALQLGASDYIVKPVAPEILRLRLRLHADNARLRRQLEELAFADSLTGLNNRRGMAMNLQRELRRCRRANLPLSLVVIDIDHFKSVNDTYGHAAGDFALQQVAITLSRHFQRATDVVARLGGEEFMVACAEMSQAEMQQKLSDCRQAISQIQLCVSDEPVDRKLTVSAGGLTLIPDDNSDLQIESLLDHADQALYQAKLTRDAQVWAELP